MSDNLRRFLFEEAGVRGELLHLDASWRAVLERHPYPPVVREILGESMVAGTLLAATLKFDGSITLQMQGNGPISLLVVECTAQRTLRGLAHWQGEVPESGLAKQFGDGRLVITIDPGHGKERYQGIVPLVGDHIAGALEHYLERSEQLATRLWLAADDERAAGLLLQRLPEVESGDADGWGRLTALGGSVTRVELLELAPEQLMHRLFHEETLRLFESEPVAFRCSCSRERVANMLRSLGRTEVDAILEEQGAVEVNCEFCNHHYHFDPVDVEELFHQQTPPEMPPTLH